MPRCGAPCRQSHPIAAIAPTSAAGEAMASALPSTHGDPTATVIAQPVAVPATNSTSAHWRRLHAQYRPASAPTATTPMSTYVRSMSEGRPRKSPTGQMPATCSSLSGCRRLPSSLDVVSGALGASRTRPREAASARERMAANATNAAVIETNARRRSAQSRDQGRDEHRRDPDGAEEAQHSQRTPRPPWPAGARCELARPGASTGGVSAATRMRIAAAATSFTPSPQRIAVEQRGLRGDEGGQRTQRRVTRSRAPGRRRSRARAWPPGMRRTAGRATRSRCPAARARCRAAGTRRPGSRRSG